VAVEVPTELSARQEELLRELAAERGEESPKVATTACSPVALGLWLTHLRSGGAAAAAARFSWRSRVPEPTALMRTTSHACCACGR